MCLCRVWLRPDQDTMDRIRAQFAALKKPLLPGLVQHIDFPTQMQDHLIPSGKRSGRNTLFNSSFCIGGVFLRQPGRAHSPSTLALGASQRFVHRQLTVRLVIVTSACTKELTTSWRTPSTSLPEESPRTR